MSGKVTNIEEIDLSSSKGGKISISIVEQPYGVDSSSVASIGISLSDGNSEPEWKVHIPKDNIDAVIASLQMAKEKL